MDFGSSPRRYLQNRELSWLKFNERVLEEAECQETPLLNRLNFVSIFTTNLDEFFMVRVGSLTDCMHFVPNYIDNKSGMTAKEELDAIYRAVRPLYDKRDAVLLRLENQLLEYGVERLDVEQLKKQEKKAVNKYFTRTMLPVLSPQIIDARHPFPHLGNKRLHIAVSLRKGEKRLFGLIPLPSGIDRLYFPDPGKCQYVLAEDILLYYANQVFDMYTVTDRAVICVTRNADLDVDAGELDENIDYRQYMKKLLKQRQRLAPVRLEVQGGLERESLHFLCSKLHLNKEQVFFSKSPLDLSYCFSLEKKLPAEGKEKLVQSPYQPRSVLQTENRMLEQVFLKDILLSYPYESMQPFLKLIKEAASDPDVLSVKITLYRLSSDSKLAQYLMEAAENGKEVTALMELRARFDEQNNIDWAQKLEEAGCRVIYGMDGYKVHSKICLITCRHGGEIRTITQIGTGNYNEKTAKLYTDLCLITADQEIGRDGQEFFMNMSMGNLFGSYHRLWIAPAAFKQNMIRHIEDETEKALLGKPAGVIMKCNSMTDRAIMKKLAEASCAGVRIRLIIRGICCLLPGIPGATENIEIISIVGRFLEHARIYCFGADGGGQKIYISSGDMMTRNTEKRVEIACPVQDKACREKIRHLLEVQLADTVKARKMLSDGNYCKIDSDGKPSVNAQEILMNETLVPCPRKEETTPSGQSLWKILKQRLRQKNKSAGMDQH